MIKSESERCELKVVIAMFSRRKKRDRHLTYLIKF
jgi:hypothetical protein